ncbi:MAG TPA: DUF4173 domain-containing protein [Acidimicrobiales bacterium]|nr:DUF4173 domain-containing protein [Acidimicrobiales bacterium]
MSTAAHPDLDLTLLVPDLTVVRTVDRRTWAATAAMAAGTDLAVRRGPGLSAAVFILMVTAALVASGRLVNPAARALALAAPVFGSCLAVYLSPPMVLLNGMAAAGLLALAASLARDGDPLDVTLPDLVRRAVVAVAHGAAAPGFLLGREHSRVARRRAGGTSPWPAIGRGVLLATPVVLVVGVLLGTADPVFASLFRVEDAGDLVLHVALLGIGAWAGGGLLRMASSVAPGPLPQTARRLGFVEAMTVVGSLVALYAAFAVAQLVAVAGGARTVLDTAGLTYAEYARSGFFQLLAVATLTLAVLLAVRAVVDVSTAARRRTFLVLSEAAVALTVAIVVVALRRLHLYEQAYGLTVARLFASVFALWVGGVFVLLALSLAGVHRRRRWLVPAAVALGLLGVVALDVVNPERVVVVRNMDHYARTGKLDVAHLAGLSDDAVPALTAALPRLDPVTRAALAQQLCGDRAPPRRDWLARSRSDDLAERARSAACGGRARP